MLIDIRHPSYVKDSRNWKRWRLSYEGGREFVDEYMIRLSRRETDADFNDRKSIAYSMRWAGSVVDRLKNSIFQRLVDVKRNGGPASYLAACEGKLGGVDNNSTKMNTFIGTEVLMNLLVTRRVGVLVDNYADIGNNLLQKGNKHPFVTMYTSENILSWRHGTNTSGDKILKAVLLREQIEENNEFLLSSKYITQYRYMVVTENGVLVQFYDEKGILTSHLLLKIKEIPFYFIEMPISLMEDTADIQIALMNLESSDISLALKGNYPFFYEFYDSRSEKTHLKPEEGKGEAADTNIKVGGAQGRRYNKDLNPPGFINPNPETLLASMKKGEQLKEDIYNLVNLNLENNARSAESKRETLRSVESDLSYIGALLEQLETRIARFWAMFEEENEATTVIYPRSYQVKTDAERYAEAETLADLKTVVPSLVYRRHICKLIAKILTQPDISDSDFAKIIGEIETSNVLTTEPDAITSDLENGLVSVETASEARGYPKGEVEQAKVDHAERLRRIMVSQGGPETASVARGIKDASGLEKAGKDTRGEAQ